MYVHIGTQKSSNLPFPDGQITEQQRFMQVYLKEWNLKYAES